MASSALACLGWGRGEREYWQEGESRSGLQNPLTTGFVFKGGLACGWDLARLPGKPREDSQGRRGRDDPGDRDSLRLRAFRQDSGLGPAQVGGGCHAFGRLWSRGLSLTKSRREGSSRPGFGWDKMCLQSDQRYTDDHGGLAGLWTPNLSPP